MKNAKKLLALILALAMTLTVFVACGDSDKKTPSGDKDKDVSVVEESKTDDEEPEVAETSKKHPCRIVQPSTLSDDYDTVIKAVNDKIEADGLDIEVSVIRIPWDTYNEKLNLMFTTGEEFELLHIMQDVRNLSSIAGMSALLPVDDLVAKYPDLEGRFTEIEWKGTLYDGQRYAIPASWRSFDNNLSYMCYREDVMQKAGYEEFPKTTDEIIDLMEKSQDIILDETGAKAYSWFHGVNQETAHWLHRSYDTYPFYVENSLGIVLARQDGTIDSFYESDEFRQDAEVYYDMYQKGLVNPDILNLDTTKKYNEADIGAFLPSQTFNPSQSFNMKNVAGIDSVVGWVPSYGVEVPDMIYTYVQNINGISSTSEDPESGIKFLDWIHQSKENHDLFHYGIEGVHYEQIGEDRMDQTRDENGNLLYFMDTWMTGYLPYMNFSKDDPDEQVEFMTYQSPNYVVSPIAGFIFDSSDVQSELTNLQTEIIASIYPIKMGMVSYEENIDSAVSKLKAAGIDRYLEEYRAQFAVYLENNPDVLEMAKGNSEEYKG